MARGQRWFLLLLFVVLASVTVLRHEMWRDELRSWQAVTAAESAHDVWHNISHEGHPGLWYALLFPLSRVTTDPVAMQLLHLMIAIGVAAVVLFFSPLPWWWRGLVVFGYFPLYEYCAISRNYAIGALLLFVACALYPGRARRPLLLAGVLFALAQASVYGLILGVAFGLMWLVEDRRTSLERPESAGGLRAVWVHGVWVTGALLSTIQIMQAVAVMHPLDPEKITRSNRLLDVLATPWRGLVPMPILRFHFWNKNFLDDVPAGDLLQPFLAISLVVALALFFRRHRPQLLFYLVGSLGLVAFSFLIYVGHVRHHGHHLLLLLACLWLMKSVDPDGAGAHRAGGALVGAVLVVNVAAGLYAVARDWRDTFSAGRDVARHIQAIDGGELPVVGHRDLLVATVGGYLRRPVYYPTHGRELIFIGWGTSAWVSVDDAEALRQARALAEERGSDVLVVLSRDGARRPPMLDGARKIGDFSSAIAWSERFELYRLSAPAHR
jgi:hypothetical protein